jgi:hypothetical protein
MYLDHKDWVGQRGKFFLGHIDRDGSERVNIHSTLLERWLCTGRVFDLIKVKDSSAQSIFDSIKNLLHKKHIPYENIIGFGADNAATMTFGHLGSVQVKLKELAPNIYIQGCLSHSLHLLLLKLQESCRAPLNNLLEMHMPTFHTPATGLMS